MPGMDGLEVLGRLKAASDTLPVVMISGHGTVATAVDATKRGAFDFIEKPLATERILLTIRNALGFSKLTDENRTLAAGGRGPARDGRVEPGPAADPRGRAAGGARPARRCSSAARAASARSSWRG